MENVYLTQRAGTTGFLGDAYSLISRLDVAFFKIKGVDFFLTPGFGFAYATRSFRTNYNPLIGSHINFAAQIGGKVQLSLSATTRIEMGLNLFHYSNAAFKLPNDGVNTINATVGIVRNINYTEPLRKIEALNINRKSSVEFGLGIGHRGLMQYFQVPLSPADSVKQAAKTSHLNNAGLYAGYSYRLNSLLSLKVATDWVYYFSTYTPESFVSTSQEYGTSGDKFSGGLSIGTDIWLGKVVFEGNYGYYLHLAYGPVPIHTYWTFGAKYYFTNWLAIEGKQYLHQTEAHYANFGVLVNLH